MAAGDNNMHKIDEGLLSTGLRSSVSNAEQRSGQAKGIAIR